MQKIYQLRKWMVLNFQDLHQNKTKQFEITTWKRYSNRFRFDDITSKCTYTP